MDTAPATINAPSSTHLFMNDPPHPLRCYTSNARRSRPARRWAYFRVTDHVPDATSASLAFARSDHVPFAVLPSKVADKATSASVSLGGKSYFAFIVFPSNESALKAAL